MNKKEIEQQIQNSCKRLNIEISELIVSTNEASKAIDVTLRVIQNRDKLVHSFSIYDGENSNIRVEEELLKVIKLFLSIFQDRYSDCLEASDEAEDSDY
jgi:hypothetical protein